MGILLPLEVFLKISHLFYNALSSWCSIWHNKLLIMGDFNILIWVPPINNLICLSTSNISTSLPSIMIKIILITGSSISCYQHSLVRCLLLIYQSYKWITTNLPWFSGLKQTSLHYPKITKSVLV